MEGSFLDREILLNVSILFSLEKVSAMHARIDTQIYTEA